MDEIQGCMKKRRGQINIFNHSKVLGNVTQQVKDIALNSSDVGGKAIHVTYCTPTRGWYSNFIEWFMAVRRMQVHCTRHFITQQVFIVQ